MLIIIGAYKLLSYGSLKDIQYMQNTEIKKIDQLTEVGWVNLNYLFQCSPIDMRTDTIQEWTCVIVVPPYDIE